VEVAQVVCTKGSRPVVLFNPSLEDVSIGIGYAGRQLRDRFLNAIESCYHIRPLDGAALFRCYPSPWQVWLETGEDSADYRTAQKPVGEEIDQILAETTQPASPQPKKPGLFASMLGFAYPEPLTPPSETASLISAQISPA